MLKNGQTYLKNLLVEACFTIFQNYAWKFKGKPSAQVYSLLLLATVGEGMRNFKKNCTYHVYYHCYVYP